MRPASRGIAILAAGLALVAAAGASGARAVVTQPPPQTSGPGGSDYSHADLRVTSGGSGNDAWYVFEPIAPRPASAPLAIVMHGYFEFSGYDQIYALIRHSALRGDVVIYPRWQTGIADPCPGPFDIEPCMASAVNGIRGALSYLRGSSSRVQPQVERTSYFGFSFGGIITANLANRYVALGLPPPRAVFLDDPEDSGLAGGGEPALDDSLSGIPPDTLLECHSGAEGALVQNPGGVDAASCNPVFPKIGQIPKRNKDLVLTHTDAHGTPALSSAHGVCAGPNYGRSAVDAYDWDFCWKVWDALQDCADYNRNCRYALGNAHDHRFLGRWSDGVPITPLKVQDESPIRP